MRGLSGGNRRAQGVTMRDERFTVRRGSNASNAMSPERKQLIRKQARELVGRPASRRALERTREPFDGSSQWNTFHDEFTEAIQQSARDRARWTRFFRREVKAATDDLGRLVMTPSDAAALRALAHEWEHESDPFVVWRRGYHAHYWRDEFQYYGGLLLRADPVAGLRVLDGLPFPQLMRDTLVAVASEDRALVEMLIQGAPLAFGPGGNWSADRSVSGLLVAELVVHHATTLRDAVAGAVRASWDEQPAQVPPDAVEQLDTVELPQWLQHAFGLLLQRADGRQIGVALLAHLARRNLLRKSDRDERAPAERVAAIALAEALRSAGVKVTEFQEFSKVRATHDREKGAATARKRRVKSLDALSKKVRPGEGARSLHGEGLPALLGAAMALGEHGQADVPSDVWQWFEELLVGRDEGLRLCNDGSAADEVGKSLALLLVRLPAGVELLRSTYTKLEPQRRRSLYPMRYEGTEDDAESLLALRVGLHLSVFLRHSAHDLQARASELWFWTYAAARRLWLTSRRDIGGEKERFVTACFAAMPLVFGDDLGAALRAAVPWIAGDEGMVGDAAALLRRNGVDMGRLVRLMRDAGVELGTVLSDARSWAELAGSEFPSHLNELALELAAEPSA